MKRTNLMRSLLAFFLLMFGNLALADKTLLGSYNCKIKTNYVLSAEDGSLNTYAGFTNKENVGDSLTFSIKGEEIISWKELFFEIYDYKRSRSFLSHRIAPVVVNDNGHVVKTGEDFSTNLVVSENAIYFDTGLEVVNFSRYFKTDYSLIYMFKPWAGQTIQVLSADCRASKHAFPGLIEYLK